MGNGSLEVLSAHGRDAELWRAYLSDVPPENRDVFHLPEFAALCEVEFDEPALLFRYEVDDGGVLLVATGWWYALFAARFVPEWLPQLLHGEVGGAGELLEERPAWPLWLLHYVWLWPDSQVGLVLGGVYLAGIAVAIRRRADPAVWSVLLWLGLGLLLFTLIPKRQPFYTLPLLPAAAVLAAAAAQRARWAAVGLAVLVTVPSALTCRPALVDRHTDVITWALVHRNPLPETWVGQRFPLGEPPDEQIIDVDALAALLTRGGVPEAAPVLVMSDDGVISESQLLSRLRIARRSAAVQGVVVHAGGAADIAGRAGAFVDLHGAQRGYPDRQAIVGAFDSRFGFDGEESVVAGVIDQEGRARVLLDSQLPSGTWLTVWALD